MERRPDFLIWVLTARCNLACKHCYASRPAWNSELDTSTLLRLIDEAYDLGVKYIHFTGGEPLLRKDIFDVLVAASIWCDVSLFTNLTPLDRKGAATLSSLEVYVYTSLDGASERTHELLRGPGTWDALMRGVALLKEEGIPFTPVLSISRHNASEAGDFVRLAERIGAMSAALIPIMPFGRAKGSGLEADVRACVEAVRLADEVASEIGFPVSLWCMPFAGLIANSRYVSWSYCRAYDEMDIAPTGDVLLCDVLDISISNVKSKGLAGAWSEVLTNPLVNRVKEGIECPGCPFSSKCRGGCYARSLAVRGTLDGPDPLCPRASRESINQ